VGVRSLSGHGLGHRVLRARVLLRRWLRERGVRCIRRVLFRPALALVVRAAHRDVRGLLRAELDGQDFRRGQDLARGQVELRELLRDRVSRRLECGLLLGRDNGVEASATRR
jgi:hypothetical protein